ncbi:MAG: hypothetical protein ABI468_01945 [Candidatus Nanopelagicales bacterium]
MRSTAQEHPSADDDGFVQWAALRRRRLRRTTYLVCADWPAADDLVPETLVRVSGAGAAAHATLEGARRV